VSERMCVCVCAESEDEERKLRVWMRGKTAAGNVNGWCVWSSACTHAHTCTHPHTLVHTCAHTHSHASLDEGVFASLYERK